MLGIPTMSLVKTLDFSWFQVYAYHHGRKLYERLSAGEPNGISKPSWWMWIVSARCVQVICCWLSGRAKSRLAREEFSKVKWERWTLFFPMQDEFFQKKTIIVKGGTKVSTNNSGKLSWAFGKAATQPLWAIFNRAFNLMFLKPASRRVWILMPEWLSRQLAWRLHEMWWSWCSMKSSHAQSPAWLIFFTLIMAVRQRKMVFPDARSHPCFSFS